MSKEERDAVARLRSALSVFSAPIDSAAREQLRTHVDRYTDEVKALGWPPEQVIRSLKSVARQQGYADSPFSILGQHARENLVPTMVRWCIDRYFPKL